MLTRNYVIRRLGGKCARCGIHDFRVLQIDHVKGDGSQERLLFQQTTQRFFQNVLKYAGKKYQLLCANCNLAKRIEMNEVARKDLKHRLIERFVLFLTPGDALRLKKLCLQTRQRIPHYIRKEILKALAKSEREYFLRHRRK
jgi:hypothetical protein